MLFFFCCGLDSYVRSEGAKDYIIYGCIGFLDLYSGKKHAVLNEL